MQITHANLVANAEAMFVGANFDPDTDVIVSWLPCFHDMGMTGFLTVPMYFGAELVKVTPMDFLRDTLLWAKLIDKYKGTMTAAPNFAYNLFAKRLRRQATPGQFDLSSLRWALSGAEQVDPVDVEDLCEAGRAVRTAPRGDPARLRHGRDDGGGVVHRVRRRPGGRRGGRRPARRPAPGGPGDQGPHPPAGLARPAAEGPGAPRHRRGRRRAARARRRRHRGARRPGDAGIHHRGRLHRGPGRRGWYDTGDLGYLTETGNVVVCGRLKDVIIMAGRNIYPTDIERAASRVDGVRPGGAVAVRLDAGHSRESFAVAVESKAFDDHDEVLRIEHQVAHEVVAEVDVRPRNVVVLEPGMIPKTPSGKLRRAHALALIA